MTWRIVQQPNGKYARFSEIVDAFTMYDMTMDGALVCCIQQGCSNREAIDKVQRGMDAGRARFREALRIIARVHGRRRMRDLCRQMGGTREDYPPRLAPRRAGEGTG
jgi:hypothetical protein